MENVKIALFKKKIKQIDFAYMIGVSPQTISNHLTGRYKARKGTEEKYLKKISEI